MRQLDEQEIAECMNAEMPGAGMVPGIFGIRLIWFFRKTSWKDNSCRDDSLELAVFTVYSELWCAQEVPPMCPFRGYGISP